MAEIPEPTHTTIDQIYRSYEDQPQTERGYLGCSTFGTECDRAFWYKFRWAAEKEKFPGRILRLFNTGHREEERLIADLRAAGCEVFEQDPETGKQYAVSALGGHLRGHLDGVCLGLVEAPKTPHVLECKTHNEKSYRDLLRGGVKKSKPGHYAQMQLYMHFMRIDRALYLAQNKNDDSLYCERVKLDKDEVARLLRRAERIIRADVAPDRLFPDPDAREAYVCGWCPAKELCHEGGWPRKNCRTCVSAVAVIDGSDAGKWHCAHWKHDLDLDDQRRGCEEHIHLPFLIPGEQIDADEAARTVTYKMQDGSVWVDGMEGRDA